MHGGLFSKDDITLDDIRKVDRNKQPPEDGKRAKGLFYFNLLLIGDGLALYVWYRSNLATNLVHNIFSSYFVVNVRIYVAFSTNLLKLIEYAI